MLAGGLQQSAQTPYPVYGVPADLRVLDASAAQLGAEVLVARPAAGNRLQVVPGKTRADAGEVLVYPKDFVVDSRTRALKGRIEQGRLRPYYTRAEINAGKGVNTAPVLAWVENDTELFFLQVQGSGRIQLEDGRYLRAGYAEQNGHGYKSIGRWLVDNGQMKLSDVSMQSIKEWIAANPARKDELFNANPSYVFSRPCRQTTTARSVRWGCRCWGAIASQSIRATSRWGHRSTCPPPGHWTAPPGRLTAWCTHRIPAAPSAVVCVPISSSALVPRPACTPAA